jgi:CcmD family protein
MPALPLDDAGKYVAGAFVVFFTLVVVYLSIMASKVARIERELSDLADLADEREREREPVA